MNFVQIKKWQWVDIGDVHAISYDDFIAQLQARIGKEWFDVDSEYVERFLSEIGLEIADGELRKKRERPNETDQ